jgi:hypothetical protein
LPQQAAVSLCSDLPSDPKLAAKQLRQALGTYGIDIKHTHALKAVAEARGSQSFLGLAEAARFEVVNWSSLAPAVSARSRVINKLGDAAEDACRRIDAEFDASDVPLMELFLTPHSIEVVGVGEPHHGWRVLVAAVNNAGEPALFQVDEQARFVERLRRLVEGELGGWLDGASTFCATKSAAAKLAMSVPLPRHLLPESDVMAQMESIFEDQLPEVEEAPLADPEGMPLQLLSTADGLSWNAVEPAIWSKLLHRYKGFLRRHGATFADWVALRHGEAEHEHFALERLRVAAVRDSAVRQGVADDEIAAALGVDLEDWERYVEQKSLPARLFTPLRLLLRAKSENDFAELETNAVSMPLPDASDVALWLSRFDTLIATPGGLGPEVAGAVSRLSKLCATPVQDRLKWDKQPPRELQAIYEELRVRGLMLCGTAGRTFLNDLPLGRSRLALVGVLTPESETAILTQRGLLDVDNADAGLPDEEHRITPDWLARFNAPKFTGEEMLKVTSKAEEMRDPHEPDDYFEAAIHASVRTFNRDPNKAHAATTRMEAAARLLKRDVLGGFVLRSAEEGAWMLSQPAFEAVARCPLIEVNGRAGFDPQTFRRLVVEYSRA